jgi:hypothetical protein
MTKLVRYDAMCRAIAAAYEVDEVKNIRDQAKALEEYSRQARNIENERKACEVRLRAERKAGQILKKQQRQGGDRRSKSRGGTLKDDGISRRQSSDWQKLGDVSDDLFEAQIADRSTRCFFVLILLARLKNFLGRPGGVVLAAAPGGPSGLPRARARRLSSVEWWPSLSGLFVDYVEGSSGAAANLVDLSRLNGGGRIRRAR